MHPIIRFISFILLVAGLATVRHYTLSIFVLSVLLFLYQQNQVSFRSLFPLLKRLRWLFLSLFILHLWFSTSELTWLPNMQGLGFAVERVLALVLVLLAAHLFVSTTPTSEIIAALQWWLTPLQYVCLPIDRVAVRLALVLDTVHSVQVLYTNMQPMKNISDRASELFMQVFTHAETAPLQVLEIPCFLPPPLWQWIYPACVGIMIMVSGQ